MKRAMKMMGLMSIMGLMGFLGLLGTTGCSPEPPLHLYDAEDVTFDLPVIDLDLQVYWDYEMSFDTNYDWRAEWYYGWDEIDQQIWGDLGYTEPSVFALRRYYTGDVPYAPHTGVLAATIEGTHFQGMYDWGFWDILCWNEIRTPDGIQSIIIDEETSLDEVTAYTNQTMSSARYQAPKYTHAFFSPEPLFAAYDQAIEINRNLEGFVYDPERMVYVKKLDMTLRPITYIYLTQIILHHNQGRIAAVHGTSNLSGMARSTCLNTGRSGEDAITVYYDSRMKNDCDKEGENVDIIGGRLMTFGLCNTNANTITKAAEVTDPYRHYMDVNVQFNNGMDSTLVFDVTDQVRKRYKGGVLTVELDMDTVPIPQRGGGSGFDAVVKPIEDGGTHEFEM